MTGFCSTWPRTITLEIKKCSLFRNQREINKWMLVTIKTLPIYRIINNHRISPYICRYYLTCVTIDKKKICIAN